MSPRHRRASSARTWALRALIATLSGVALAIIAGFFAYSALQRNLPSVEEMLHRQVAQSTKIYDRSGKVLLYEISAGERRTIIPIADVPQYLKDAAVAVEDDNFYNEPAFDWKAIVRSLLANLKSGEIVQGGSTITQQLAKNAFLTPEKTITRKLKELILATNLARQYTKDQILELYLNEIPYGPTAYGVEAASQTFFGKTAKDLTLGEAAVLAALPKAPTYYSPWGTHREELFARGQFILKKMRSLWKISEEEYLTAQKERVVFAPQGQTIKAPHFVMLAQDYLTQKYGEDLVQRGGLQVLTTLDWDLQQLAQAAVREGAQRNQELYGGDNAALVAQDPKTGHVLALAGSRDYFDTEHNGNFNAATQGLRQPGSALKPFVYLTAFEKGYTPDTVLFDVSTEFAARDPDCPAVPAEENEAASSTVTTCFHPHNFDGSFRGPMPLREALAMSRNLPAVKLLYLAGIRDVLENTRRFGITTLTDPGEYGLSLVLGGGAVHLSDLVGAYATLANDGIKHAQTYVLEVKDSKGVTIESYQDASEQVVDPQYVRLVNDILSDVEARRKLFGNSTSYTILSDRDVAMKTGTSNDYRDAWSIGYTPSLAVGVWAGSNDNAPMHKSGTSIFAAVPIWSAFFQAAHASRNFPVETFPRPEPVAPVKPILAGDYRANREIHSILYYVDRSDPTGPPPQAPAEDPQFENWETGVLRWAASNMPDFAEYNRQGNTTGTLLAASSSLGFAQLTIETPRNGDVLQGASSPLRARLSGSRSAQGIGIRLNGQLLENLRGPFSAENPIIFTVPLANAKQQNLLEMEATDENGMIARTQVIFYR
ncbi:MAG: transglycosylase domain-containing protein [Candidatus Liptonbacteria bacterium]|nr:transglycosylase domain-containing protein [Candidatus Liptonbacteria bacterium]